MRSKVLDECAGCNSRHEGTRLYCTRQDTIGRAGRCSCSYSTATAAGPACEPGSPQTRIPGPPRSSLPFAKLRHTVTSRQSSARTVEHKISQPYRTAAHTPRDPELAVCSRVNCDPWGTELCGTWIGGPGPAEAGTSLASPAFLSVWRRLRFGES